MLRSMSWLPLASLHDTHHDPLCDIYWMVPLPSGGRSSQGPDQVKVRGNGYDGRQASKVPVVHYLALSITLDQAIYPIYRRAQSIIQAIHILIRFGSTMSSALLWVPCPSLSSATSLHSSTFPPLARFRRKAFQARDFPSGLLSLYPGHDNTFGKNFSKEKEQH